MTKINSGATFSPCRKYRYKLWRIWDDSLPMVAFIGLNPSTADETKNDPTITRCINYAKKWGYGGMYMMNIFAFRATDPNVMKAEKRPIGPENDYHLYDIAKSVESVVCSWGNHGSHADRSEFVTSRLFDDMKLHCLGTNKSGEPKHPLYLKADLEPIEFSR
jgi:hypothetical protein